MANISSAVPWPPIPYNSESPELIEYLTELHRQLTDFLEGDRAIAGNIETGGELYIHGVTVGVTNVSSSPYTVLGSDNNIFVNSTGGNITVNLPAGTEGKYYRIINVGTGSNVVTVTPNGSELLTGANASRDLSDSSVVILVYSLTKGWY